MALTSARQHAMPQWRDEFEDFASLDALVALTFDRRPSWVWSVDGQRLLWSNGTGLMRLGVTSFSDAAGTELANDSPLREDLAQASATASISETMVMLRLPAGSQTVPSPCRCRRIMSRSGEPGLLVIVLDAALDAKFETAINNEALELLFSDDRTLAFVDTDPNGDRRLNLEERTVEAEARIALDRLVPPRRTQVDEDGQDSSSLAATGLSLAQEALDLSKDEADPVEPPLAAGALTRPADAATVSYKPRGRDRLSTSGAQLPKSSTSQALSVGSLSELAVVDAEREAKRPVRFLWQTDAAVRFLFVSNGLTQTLGRGADIVGETWSDAASRMGLDPHGRIGRSFKAQDTWSGLTAWWPLEGGDRIPVEMTALPVYSLDRKFQGFRGFGVIRPGDIIPRQQFESRFPTNAGSTPPRGLKEERTPGDLDEDANVIPIRPDMSQQEPANHLSDQEKTAFEEIATSLSAPDDAFAVESEFEPAEKRGPSDVKPDTIWDDDHGGDVPKAADEAADETLDERPAKPVMPIARPLVLPAIVNEPNWTGAIGPDDLEDEDGEEDEAAQDAEISDLRQQISDLTSQRDDALRRNMDLGALLDLLPSGSLGLDSGGQIMTANAPAQTLLADPKDTVLGRSIMDFLSEDDALVMTDAMAEMINSAKLTSTDGDVSNPEPTSIVVSSRKSGHDLLMTLRTVKETNEIGFIASLQDFSQWKRREGDLRAEAVRAQQTSDQKSDFLAWVSHEIRTPLGAIIGFAEVLMEERFGPIENKKYRDYARDIRSSGQHVLSLVNDLLDLSKIEAGYFEINVTEVSINDVIQNCLTIMYPQANTKQVVLRTSLSQIVPDILADNRTMRQIILNLMSNSIKYTGSGGQVVVSSNKADDGGVVIKVRDTGEGMSEEDLRRAMEPFQQLGAAHGSGTGLGLPLTKLLVEANEAAFDIRSSEGEGTIATIVFPPSSTIDD